MKQFVTVLAAVMLLSISAFAADYVKVGNVNDDISVIVRESNDSRIVVDYQIGGFTQEGVQINGETYYQIQCGEENEPLIAGVPALPRICRSIIIPDNGEMRVNIISSEYVDYPATPVIPSKGPISRTINKADVPYEFGDVYNNSEFYPSNVAELREPFIIRDFRGTVIEFNGFQYNPDTRTLRVYKSVTIEVVNTGLAGTNELQRSETLTSVVPDFDLIYKSRFINYPETMTTYTLVPETGEMLIITYDSYYNNMLPFAEWKNQKGIKTTMVNVSSIGNNESSIRSYIQTAYNTTDLAFVLLVGDNTHVAPATLGSDAADPIYTKVSGSDDYPDIFIGRFSAESTGDVDTQVDRTIAYESNSTGSDWFHKATGIASNEGPGHNGEYDNEHMDLIRGDLLAYNYTIVDQIYDPGASASQITTALNNGRSFINYVGHGSKTAWSTTGFSNSDVNTLSNAGMLPAIYSVACVNGDFDGGTPCFGEAWLRARSGGQPIGAIAAYMSSINQDWDSPMEAEDEACDLLCAEVVNTFGGICFNSSCQMMDAYGSVGIEMFNTWHIFGDPSVQLRTDDPAGITVSHDSQVPFMAPTFSVTVQGVEGALCALYYNEVSYGSAYTNGSGVAVINIDGPLPIGVNVVVTATGYNKRTYVGSVLSTADGSYGTITGRITDSGTGDGLVGTVTVTNRTPQISVNCNSQGYYSMGVPADTLWQLMATGPAYYDTAYSSATVTDGGTVTRNFVLTSNVSIDVLFSDDFSSNQGWTGIGGSGEWTIGAATGGAGSDSYGGPDPSTDHSPGTDNGVLGNDLTSGSGGDYSASLSSTYWVTSPVINCSNYADVSFKFYRWLGIESDNYDDVYLQVYNGSIWTTIFENSSTTIDESSWNEVTYDVSVYADSNAAFRIRFGIGGSDGSWQYCGWNIDDIEITGLTSSQQELPDVSIDMIPDDDPAYTTQGGYIDFTGKLFNNTAQQQYTDVWIMLVLPNSNWYGPIRQWNNIPLAPNDSLVDSNARQFIPGYALLGEYEYWAFCGDYPSVKMDSAMFEFMVFAGMGKGGSDWNLEGWFDNDESALPLVTALYDNYPNPFNPSTTIKYDLATDSHVKLEVYNLMGQKVETLVNSDQSAGNKVVDWDAGVYSSGVYFYKLSAGDKQFVKQMTLVK